MFPTPSTGGDDLNRRPAQSTSAGSSARPKSLTATFYLLLVTAAFMVLTGLVLFTIGYTGPEDADQAFQETVVQNQRLIGSINFFAGVVIAALASLLPRSGKNVRRLLLGILVLVVLVDLLSFITRGGGFALAVIAIALAVAALLMFRPDVNTVIAQNHSSRRTDKS